MRLINVKAVLEREESIRERKEMNGRTKVLEFRDDEATSYAILSHRWVEQEVNYDEMVELVKMEREERDEVRQRAGYRKILDSCEQARRDGHDWLWIDTCCIDKRSSAELSEAINSMYRWYENSKVCYAYLHDVPDPSFPTASDKRKYPKFNGWPEWFSRGWTLQEMIAPRNVRFFNNSWQPIGDKRTLAEPLANITRVPQRILTNGLSSNRPCIAQIMSWAADRMTTRVEDRAYSLLGLLDVNMPMLYGEGKRAFQRLQLEIIRVSDDQSIFAWGFKSTTRQTGSILADDPRFFRGCHEMELIDPDEFIESLKDYIPEEELRFIQEDRLGTFPITNRGIQIWLLLHPCGGSRAVFKARLPCRIGPSGPPESITLALWKSNYYRYSMFLWDGLLMEGTLQFRQLYLRYQDTPHRDATFEIDDSAVTENGLIYCGGYPSTLTGNTFTLTNTNLLRVKVYSDSQATCRFAVGFGQCFGQDWIHLVYDEHASTGTERSWRDYAEEAYYKILAGGPEYARSMAKTRSRRESYAGVCITQTHLPGSTWTVQTCCIMWESSRNCGVRVEVFQNSSSGDGLDKWRSFDVDGADDPDCDMRGLMIPHSLEKLECSTRLVEGVSVDFLRAPKGIKLGDYGHFTDSEVFHREGNIFSDLKSLASEADITPRWLKIDEEDKYNTGSKHVETHDHSVSVRRSKLLGLSLPSNHCFLSLLASLSTRFTNRYLVTKVLGNNSSRSSSLDTNRSSIRARFCVIAKPLVWHRDEGAGFMSVESLGSESRDKC